MNNLSAINSLKEVVSKNDEYGNLVMKFTSKIKYYFSNEIYEDVLDFDEFGNKCMVVYNNSFLVPAKLHKFHSLWHFKFVGQLTELGIDFVTDNIDNLPMVSWEEYNS